MAEGQALQQQWFHLQKACRHQNGHHIIAIQLGTGGCTSVARHLHLLRLRTVLDPFHEPIKDLYVAMHRYIHLFQPLACSYIRKVAHFADEQILRAGEVPRGVLHLIADMYDDFGSAKREGLVNKVVINPLLRPTPSFPAAHACNPWPAVGTCDAMYWVHSCHWNP